LLKNKGNFVKHLIYVLVLAASCLSALEDTYKPWLMSVHQRQELAKKNEQLEKRLFEPEDIFDGRGMQEFEASIRYHRSLRYRLGKWFCCCS